MPPKPSADAKSAKPTDAPKTNTAASWARLIVEVAAIFFVVRTFLIAGYRIPSVSMEPTLLTGDWLFVTPLPLGPHIPFTNWTLPGFMDPKRGTINIYESPPQHKTPDAPYMTVDGDSIPTIVKRIVGTPGDTIYMRQGVFYVNGAPLIVPNLPARDSVTGSDAAPIFSWQHKYELSNSRFGPPPAVPTHDDWGPLLVPPKSYFSLGDNRYNSIDARYYGWIPRKNFRGRPLIIYFSFDVDDLRFRWSRFFTLLWSK